jgi:hypothetical protein
MAEYNYPIAGGEGSVSTWAKVGEVISSVAPILGAAVGGPVGAIAGAAGSLVAEWLGVDSDPKVVEKVLQAHPDTILKLKELESAERIRLIEWQAQQLQAALADVQGARNREIELAKVGHKAAWGTSIISGIITVGFFGMIGTMVGMELTGNYEEYSAAVMMLLGSLNMGFGSVTAYYLGGSRSPKETPPAVQISSAMLAR